MMSVSFLLLLPLIAPLRRHRRRVASSRCTTFSNRNACKPKKARSEIHSICGRQAANSPIRMDLLGWSIRNASASGREEAERHSVIIAVRSFEQIGGDCQICNRVNHQSPKLATWRKSFSASRSCLLGEGSSLFLQFVERYPHILLLYSSQIIPPCLSLLSRPPWVATLLLFWRGTLADGSRCIEMRNKCHLCNCIISINKCCPSGIGESIRSNRSKEMVLSIRANDHSSVQRKSCVAGLAGEWHLLDCMVWNSNWRWE